MGTLTYKIVRILGNDIPTRHAPSQTLQNTRYILQREAAFENCQKQWVLNRIRDQRKQDLLIELLQAHNQDYFVIPFVEAEFDAISNADYRAKCHYLVNVNGSRNYILRNLASKTSWTLPLDGGCFFTTDHWNEFRKLTSDHPQLRYIIINYARAKNYRQVFSNKRLRFFEEPQVAFRHDFEESYREDLGYGENSKIELLRRIRESDYTLRGGKLIRLPSGRNICERSSIVRDIARRIGMDVLINHRSPNRFDLAIASLKFERKVLALDIDSHGLLMGCIVNLKRRLRTLLDFA